MQYTLNFNISSQDVSTIKTSGQQITLVKSVLPTSPVNLPVVWLQFTPFGNDVVTWDEEYYIYAATQVVQSGATISMSSNTDSPAQVSQLYTFSNNVFTTGTGGSSSQFTMMNSNSQNLTFGLAQPATVGSTSVPISPLNAIEVLNNEQASFTPVEIVSIYLSASQSNGVVLSTITGTALQVTLSSSIQSASIGFNDSSNTFFLT